MVAGIVICTLLFLVVIALVAYNIYLCLHRRAANRRYRARHVTRQLDPDSGWKPREYLYSSQEEEAFKGSGTINAGYQGSTGSVASSRTSNRMPLGGNTNVHPGYNGAHSGVPSRGRDRGVGGVRSAPRAQYEDDGISSDSGSDESALGSRPDLGNPSGHMSKPHRSTLRASPAVWNGHAVPEPRSTRHQNHHATGDDYPSRNYRQPSHNPAHVHVQSRCGNGLHAVVAAPRQEVTLRPQQLAAQWDRKPPPPMFRQQRHSADGERTSCLAVLTAEAANMRVADVRSCDVSLTGCGAQTVPNLGFVPPSGGGSVLNGGFQYNCY